jgi:hypothetical protein
MSESARLCICPAWLGAADRLSLRLVRPGGGGRLRLTQQTVNPFGHSARPDRRHTAASPPLIHGRDLSDTHQERSFPSLTLFFEHWGRFRGGRMTPELNGSFLWLKTWLTPTGVHKSKQPAIRPSLGSS